MAANASMEQESAAAGLPMRPGRRWVRLLLPLLLVGLIIASILFIAWYTYRTNRAVVLDLTDDLLETVELRIASEVEAYLEPAAVNAKLAARIGAADALRMEPGSEFDTFGVELLRQHSQLAMLNAADTQGNFLMPKEFPDGSIDTKIIRRTESGTTVQWIRRDPNGRVERIESAEDDGYDPRVRPWYRGAVETGGLYWTDVYIFFTDRKPGVTAAYPVVDDDGKTLGVLGIDIELDELCRFLGELKIGRTGRAMIIDESGTVIAHPDVTRISKTEGETVRPVSVSELQDRAAARAFARFQVDGHGRHAIEVDERAYIVTIDPMAGVGRDWSAMILVPEDDFVGLIEAGNRRALALSLVVVAIGLALAMLVAIQSWRADRSESATGRQMYRLESRSRAFSGVIAALADGSLPSTQRLRRMTELASQGMDVRRISVWRPGSQSKSLRCIESFERGAGHADGSELHRTEYPSLFRALDEGQAIEVRGADSSFDGLHLSYLKPLELESILMIPVSSDGEVRVWIWFEFTGTYATMSAGDRSYADAIAGIVALGCGELAGRASIAAGSTMTTTNDVGEPVIASDIDEETAPVPEEARPPRRIEGIELDTAASVQAYTAAAVLAIVVDEPRLLLASNGRGDASVGATVQRLILQSVDAGHVSHWMAAGSALCCIALPNSADGDIIEGAEALAWLAIRIRRQLADRLAVAPEKAPARFAIDYGSVGMIPMEDAPESPQCAGPAVAGAFALARSAPQGAIQLSADAEKRLQAGFVCRERGPYLVDGVGELQTFLLVGQLRR